MKSLHPTVFALPLAGLFLVHCSRSDDRKTSDAPELLDYRETPVRLVEWPTSPSPQPARDAFPDWAFSMKIWPFDILEPDATDRQIARHLDDAASHGADVVIFYIESEHMYGSFVDQDGFAQVTDRIEVLTTGAALRNLRTIVYVNGLEVMTAGAFDTACEPTGIATMATEHPDWLQVDLDGEPIVYKCQDSDWLEPDWEDAWVSPFSDYRSLFTDRITALAGAGVDAVYIDATFLPGYQEDYDQLRWGSSDDGFAEAFAEATGLEVPRKVNPGSSTFQAFLAFRHEALADYLGDLAGAASDAGIIAFWESSANDTSEGTLLGNETAVTGRAGLGHSPEIEPEDDWLAAFRMAKAGRELNLDRPMIYLGWPEDEVAAEIEYATALAHSGTYYPTADIDRPEHAFGLMDDLSRILDRRVPYSGDLVLVYSVRNKDHTWESEETFQAYVHAFEELAARHMPFRIIPLEYLPEDGLEGVQTVVLPGVRAISDDEAALLQGRSVVLLGDGPGSRDESWEVRSQPVALGHRMDLDDVRVPLPFGITAPAGTFIEYYQDREGERVLYLFAVSPHPGGHIELSGAEEDLLVKVWRLGGEVDERRGGRVTVSLSTRLTVLEVAPDQGG